MKNLLSELRVPFDILGNAHHHVDGLTRILAGSCFCGQHDRIGTIENGIGHIGGFGARRPRTVDHTFQHLCRRDHRFSDQVALANDALLDQRHFFGIDLHPQVSPGNHDTVSNLKDGVEILNRFGLLNLGNDPDGRLPIIEPFLQFHDIGSRTDEGESNIIKLFADTEIQVFQVFPCQGWRRNRNPREVHTLAVFQLPTDQNLTVNVFFDDLVHLQLKQTVIQQDSITRVHVARQFTISGRYNTPLTEHVRCGHHHGLTCRKRHNITSHYASTDLRPLQVTENRHRTTTIHGKLADDSDDLSQLVVIPMGKIQAKHINACGHQRL